MTYGWLILQCCVAGEDLTEWIGFHAKDQMLSAISMKRYDMRDMAAERPLVVCQHALIIVTVLMSSCMLLVVVPMVSGCNLLYLQQLLLFQYRSLVSATALGSASKLLRKFGCNTILISVATFFQEVCYGLCRFCGIVLWLPMICCVSTS